LAYTFALSKCDLDASVGLTVGLARMPGCSGMDAVTLAAKVVGRWRDGPSTQETSICCAIYFDLKNP